ncbi:hypothetical protein ALC62_09149 [Cyphomyrmex costatus]|uniref:Uncharacterized protein n=1 Tax=Cyphomyrmex costatus TaxID=456900 RepID=A0A195CI32_9HYME|nr:hypothetical protein ALC62_09149 [Cyphomyrmex costatus]
MQAVSGATTHSSLRPGLRSSLECKWSRRGEMRGEARNIVIEKRKDTESMLNRPFVRNKSATHGKKKNKYPYRYPIFLASNSCVDRSKDIGMYDINVVYNVDEFRCNARDNHYVSNVSGRAAANPDFFRPPFLLKSCNVSARSTRRLGSATFRKFAPHAGLVQLAPGVLERTGIREFNVFSNELNCKTTSPPGRFEIEYLGDVEFLLDVYRKRDDNPAISDTGNKTPPSSKRLFSWLESRRLRAHRVVVASVHPSEAKY